MKNLNFKSKFLLSYFLVIAVFAIFSISVHAAAPITKDILMKGDTIKYTGSSVWSVYSTASLAKRRNTNLRITKLKTNATFTIKAISGNVLKIGTGKYIYYTDYATKYCKVISHTDSKNHKFTLYRQDSSTYYNIEYPGRYKGISNPKNNKNPIIGKNGCGPTSCAIIASGYGYKDTPATIVKDGNNYSTATGIKNFFKNKGFTVEVYTKGKLSDKDLKTKLSQGYKIIVLVDYNGKVGNYSTNGFQHWYTLLDISGDKVYVGDPLSNHGGLYNLSQLTNRITHICVKK